MVPKYHSGLNQKHVQTLADLGGRGGAAAPPIAGRRGRFNESGFWELGGFKLWGRREAS